MIQIKSYPAKNGDCFLISAGAIKKTHILIDCGYVDTYESFLKKDLMEIAQRNEKINLMIVTHIDSDHISGAIKFIDDNNRDRFIEIEEVWFNAYRHLQISKKNDIQLQELEESILEREIALGKSFFKRVNQDVVTKDEISAKQGSTLGALLLQGKYNWNSQFDGKAIMSNNNQSITINDFKINVLSPDEEKLNKLADIWIKELRKKKWNFNINENELFDDAFEFMQLMLEDESTTTVSEISKKNNRELIKLEEYIEKEYPVDESVNNGSSIAVLIEFNKIKLLFLADAHPGIILDNLKGIDEINFDFVKVSHHGSVKNISNELIEILCSTRYLFSTNGVKHNHPDSETIIKLLAANSKFKKKLYFNYNTETSSKFENKELQDKYNYEIVSVNDEKPLVIEF